MHLLNYCPEIFLQGLLKKHEAFETDLEVHRERVQDIENDGNQLIEKVSLLHGVNLKSKKQ